MEIFLLGIGGTLNAVRFHGIAARSAEEDMPFKGQGYALAFGMGALFYGLPMLAAYKLFF